MISVLAIDPGHRTGWATQSSSGAEAFLTARERRAMGREARHSLLALRFQGWLDAALYRSQAGVLVLERQQMGRGGGEVTLGLRMLALWTARRQQVAVEEVEVGAWRKWARANAGYDAAAKDDELDARMILAYWLARNKALDFLKNRG